jgi:hypothetical protein
MAIIGFILLCVVLLYFLAVACFGIFSVGFSIAMGGTKTYWYLVPIAGLLLDLWLFWLLFQHAPFTISLI